MLNVNEHVTIIRFVLSLNWMASYIIFEPTMWGIVNTLQCFSVVVDWANIFYLFIFENIVQTIGVLTSKYLYFAAHKSNVVLL